MTRFGTLIGLLLLFRAPIVEDPPPVPDMPAFKERGADIKYLGKNVWLDANPASRRVLVRATICANRVQLEEFMCLKRTKEHESIVAADLVPSVFHAALLASGAVSGEPCKFEDGKFHPPTGDRMEIIVEWKDGDKFKRARAQDWIRDVVAKQPIKHDFVFAGSQWVTSPISGEKVYLGNEGDLVSVANFSSSIIDIAIRSSSANVSLQFETFPDRIPPVDTEVTVIFRSLEKRPQDASVKKKADG